MTGIDAGRCRSAPDAGTSAYPLTRTAVALLNRAVGVCCHQQTADFMNASVAASPFRTVRVVGIGRAGTAIAARLRERGALAVDTDASVVLLCVPDAVIAHVAATIRPGPWVAHVSGATPLQALDPHQRRFSVHPLQTLVRGRGPEQLDGAYAAVTAESPERARPRTCAREAAGTHTVRPRRRPACALSCGSGARLQLPRDAPSRGGGALRGRRRSTGGAASAHPENHRQRVRVDRADLARRLEHRRCAPRMRFRPDGLSSKGSIARWRRRRPHERHSKHRRTP